MDFWGIHIETPVIAITFVMSIPLSAIIGHFYLSALKIRQGQGLEKEDIRFIKEKLAENEDLKQRVKNLEEIITDLDKTLPPSKSGL